MWNMISIRRRWRQPFCKDTVPSEAAKWTCTSSI